MSIYVQNVHKFTVIERVDFDELGLEAAKEVALDALQIVVLVVMVTQPKPLPLLFVEERALREKKRQEKI